MGLPTPPAVGGKNVSKERARGMIERHNIYPCGKPQNSVAQTMFVCYTIMKAYRLTYHDPKHEATHCGLALPVLVADEAPLRHNGGGAGHVKL